MRSGSFRLGHELFQTITSLTKCYGRHNYNGVIDVIGMV